MSVGKEVVKHTAAQFLRIYPDALQIASGNKDPVMPWATGAQMVALNTQTAGPITLINQVN